MRHLPIGLIASGLLACGSTGTPTSAAGTTAGSATGGASSGTGAASTGGGTGTAGTSSTGSGGSVASSSTGASPIGLWFGGSAAVNATELLLGGPQKLSDKCPPPDPNANPAGASAFDGEGNLWVQYPSDTNPLYKWTASQLGQECASGMPAVTLTSTSFGAQNQGFSAIAFDSQGNLWCVNPGVSLVGFRASDLLANGSIEPAWGFQAVGPMTDALLGPLSLAFDRAGNLWVGNSYSVIAYSPSTLAAAVTVDGGISQSSVSADFQITNANDIADLQASQPASFAYRFLAFDAEGDLWVTIENTEAGGVNEIAEYSAAELGALDGNDEPAPVSVVTVKVANSVVWGPLAFDSAGSLWAGVEGGQPNLYRFSKSDLTPGSNPDLSLVVPGGSAASLAFDPIPNGLPIQP